MGHFYFECYSKNIRFSNTFESQKKLNCEKSYLSFCHDPLKKTRTRGAREPKNMVELRK